VPVLHELTLRQNLSHFSSDLSWGHNYFIEYRSASWGVITSKNWPLCLGGIFNLNQVFSEAFDTHFLPFKIIIFPIL
jgi:hypothetical protein